MALAEYVDGVWQNARIVPHAPIPLAPSLSALHYGQSVFEGMRAYKDENDTVLLFRVPRHCARLNRSLSRMAMPEIPEELFHDLIKSLVDIDRNWISKEAGRSLYLRPFVFATDTALGVRPAKTYTFCVLASPTGEYYSKPLKVKVEREYTRAAPGGTGFAKAAGNYAASMLPTQEAQKAGFDQLMWTDSKTHEFLEESGTMNLFAVINDTLITPAVSDTILSGITRDSIITIAKSLGKKVEERSIAVKEIVEASKNSSLKELFGTGTAVTVAPIASFSVDGIEYTVPPITEDGLAMSLKSKLESIKRGKAQDEFKWVERV